MSLKIQARIEGAEKLRAMLAGMPQQIQRRVLRPALNAEGSRVVTATKSNVPKESGLLRKSLGKKTKTYTDSGVVLVVAGPRTGYRQMYKGRPRNPVKYSHLVEFGARPHLIAARSSLATRRVYSGRLHPGAPAQKPLTRGYQSALAGAAERMAARMAVEIEKQAAKGAFGKGS